MQHIENSYCFSSLFFYCSCMRDGKLADWNRAIVCKKWKKLINGRLYLSTALGMGLVLLNGCATSVGLKNNTVYQGSTVGDLVADQVLFNLVRFHDYWTDTNSFFNGIPSFIQISTGQSQSQHSYTVTVAGKVPTIIQNAEEDPSLAGTFQNQDNWGLVPVTDPAALWRLYNLYKVQFIPRVGDKEFSKMFTAVTPTDAQGRPLLKYAARTNTNGAVIMTADFTNPTFSATVVQPHKFTRDEIPGSDNDPWFTFDPCKAATNAGAILVDRKYIENRHEKLWILNREKFLKFALLTLGGTNGLPYAAGAGNAGSATPLHISNGFLIH